MALFKNFKSVTYCVAQWADKISEKELRSQTEWLQKYVGIDKVYLETFRGSFARKEQILMIKKVLEEYGIEVSGGITSVCPDFSEEDKKRQRLFETFCYCNETMRNKLIEVSEYTASLFDEFIIDDFFFTQCTCEDCIREKGNLSWSEFRLKKMMDVSKNLILGSAKKVNPNCKVIIKYPNWRESYHETGYNPKQQREIFDSIYTGTEARHSAQHDQHLPRYLSYSLPRYMENVAPGRNGGGWFDAFDCDRIDTYLEQAYLTAFSKCKELMMFCWPLICYNKRATPLGFQFSRIDKILSECGNPVGTKVYIPFNSCGDDHIEDFLGMAGIPFEPTPDFPSFNADSVNTVFVTSSSLKDENILEKIRDFVMQGGKVIATPGFIIEQQKKDELAEAAGSSKKMKLSELTAIKYTNRTLSADQFQIDLPGNYGRNYVNIQKSINFPLLEHRNNASWTTVNAGHGEYHEGLIIYDTYGKGKFEVINLPQLPSQIYELPAEVLTAIRYEFLGNGKIWLDCDSGVSLFTYDNNTFGLYCYANDGCKPMDFNVHIKADNNSSDSPKMKLKLIKEDENLPAWIPTEFEPETIRLLSFRTKEKEYIFHLRINPGDFKFFKIIK